jgi:hypothetical protein
MAGGMYYAVLDATDTDTIGSSSLYVHVSGALACKVDFAVLDEAVYDVIFGTTAPSTLTAANVNSECDTAISDAALATAANLATVDTVVDGIEVHVHQIDSRVLGTIAAGTHNAQSGDSYAVVNGASGLVAIKTETALILADTGTDGVVIPQAQADKVWGTASRVLTAGTNIALAKGSGVTGFNDLSAADVRASVGLASANLDTQIGTLATGTNLATVDGIVDAIKLKTDLIPASPAAVGSAMALEASAVDAIHDEVVEGSTSLRQAIRLMMSALFGKVSGAPTGPILFRDIGDTKARITATVDLDGNRTAVTKDAT